MDTINYNDNPQTFYGVFNKHTKALYAFEVDKVTAYNYCNKNFIVKEIELKPFEYYYGDYDNGQVYHESKKPLVREDELERKLYQEIATEYTFFEQISILIEVLDKNKEIVKTEQFEKLAKFLKAKRLRYEQGLKVMKESKDLFNFISKKEIQELDLKRVQGIV
jgi:hypothetical protein